MSAASNTSSPDAFNNWLKLKDIQDKVIILLDQLDQSRGQGEEILQEVGVSLAAIDMLLEVSFFFTYIFLILIFLSFLLTFSFSFSN